jgi:hypothetical protein
MTKTYKEGDIRRDIALLLMGGNDLAKIQEFLGVAITLKAPLPIEECIGAGFYEVKPINNGVAAWGLAGATVLT